MKINKKQTLLGVLLIWTQISIYGTNNSNVSKEALQRAVDTFNIAIHSNEEKPEIITQAYTFIKEVKLKRAKELTHQPQFYKYISGLIKDHKFATVDALKILFAHNGTLINRAKEERKIHQKAMSHFNRSIFESSNLFNNFIAQLPTQDAKSEFAKNYFDRLTPNQRNLILNALSALKKSKLALSDYLSNQSIKKVIFLLKEADYLDAPTLMQTCTTSLTQKLAQCPSYNAVKDLPNHLYEMIDPENILPALDINNAIMQRLPDGLVTKVSLPDSVLKQNRGYPLCAFSRKGKIAIFDGRLCFLWDPQKAHSSKALCPEEYNNGLIEHAEFVTEHEIHVTNLIDCCIYDFNKNICRENWHCSYCNEEQPTDGSDFFTKNREKLKKNGLEIYLNKGSFSVTRHHFVNLIASLTNTQKEFLLKCSKIWIKDRTYNLPINEYALFNSLPGELKQPELFDTSSIKRFVTNHKNVLIGYGLFSATIASAFIVHKLNHK